MSQALSVSERWLAAFTHLRVPFSLFLAPTFFFALSVVPEPRFEEGLLGFIIMHLLVYPASHAFNSYYDKDEEAIGGLAAPPPVTHELIWLANILDLCAIGLALFIDVRMAMLVLAYILGSRMYSHPLTRVKAQPWASWFSVALFQGGVTFLAAAYALGGRIDSSLAIPAMICFALLGSTYPLTQVYQHREDARRGDLTISRVLGVRGTFYFALALQILAGVLLIIWTATHYALPGIAWLAVCGIPILAFAGLWFSRVLKDERAADHTHAMRMNLMGSVGMLAFFLGLAAGPAL